MASKKPKKKVKNLGMTRMERHACRRNTDRRCIALIGNLLTFTSQGSTINNEK